MVLVAGILMILTGMAVALFVLTATALDRADRQRGEGPRQAPFGRDGIAGSIIFQIARLGGVNDSDARHLVRQYAQLTAPVTADVDIPSWSAEFARLSDAKGRARLLESAVRVAVATSPSIPLAQYDALLDLSFGLGFQTDALARLRARYRFEYVDHAKRSRPRSADRGGDAMPLFVRAPGDERSSLEILELRTGATRPEIIAAYRRLAAGCHPDRFHEAGPDAQQTAAGRFIRITEAYENLLARLGD